VLTSRCADTEVTTEQPVIEPGAPRA
jgi:hypothetical protein